jgi:DNA-binding CsgD family transcriptional regulator
VPRKRSTILVSPIVSPLVESPLEQRTFLRLEITERQLEILNWVHAGKSATDIGCILGISHRTVEHHLEKACQSLGVRTRFQAVLKARDLGLVGPPSS